MKKITIIMAATDGNYFSGGAPKSFLSLCLELKKKGINVIVWLPSKGILQKKCEEAGLQCFIVNEKNTWTKEVGESISGAKRRIKTLLNKKVIQQNKKFLEAYSPQLVHINAITGGQTLAIAAHELNIPVVWHIREFLEEDLNIEFQDKKSAFNTLNNATGLIAISNAVKNSWSKRLKVPIYTAYNGVNIDDYLVENKIDNKENCNIILYGRIAPGKNQLFYLKGINQLKNKKKYHFYLAGAIEDEHYYKKCLDYISKNNLEHNVTYLGEVKNIKELLKDKNIVCVCSKKEGFGRVNVEALLAQCLVVASNAGASKEIINDGKNGYIYVHDNINDFVKKLTLAIEKKDTFNFKEIQEHTKKLYSSSKNAEEILKVYRKMNLVN